MRVQVMLEISVLIDLVVVSNHDIQVTRHIREHPATEICKDGRNIRISDLSNDIRVQLFHESDTVRNSTSFERMGRDRCSGQSVGIDV